MFVSSTPLIGRWLSTVLGTTKRTNHSRLADSTRHNCACASHHVMTSHKNRGSLVPRLIRLGMRLHSYYVLTRLINPPHSYQLLCHLCAHQLPQKEISLMGCNHPNVTNYLTSFVVNEGRSAMVVGRSGISVVFKSALAV